MKQTTAQSQGKVIISGEHSVVYGQPALVGGVKLFREVVVREPQKRQIAQSAFIENIFNIFEQKYGIPVSHLEVLDLGKLPVGSGLGSSAAFSHAIFLSLLKHFDLEATKQDLFTLVQESEKFSHGNPSGVDATAVVYGGLVEFIKGTDTHTINHLHKDQFFTKTNFYLIDSGRPTESTREMVEFVAQKLHNDRALQQVVQAMGEVTKNLISTVRSSQFSPELITENQRLLEKLGVVGEKASSMIQEIESIGAVAKITGAGGIKTGSGMILAYSDNHDKISDLIKKNKWKSYQVQIG